MRLKLLAAAAALGGCVPTSFYTHPVPLDVQADQFNTTAARAERLMIVRNVMRARDRTSMMFTRLTGFTGSMQSTLSAGAGLDLHEGGGGGVFSPGVNVEGETSPSFNLAILNDQKFHRAIEAPIDMGLYESLIESGWRANLLHTLFIERVEFQGQTYDNDPANEENFNAFQNWLHSQAHPLQLCSQSTPEPLSPPMTGPTTGGLQGAAAIAAQSLELQQGPAGTYQVVRPHSDWWFAFSCGDPPAARPQVIVRSIEGVMFYLGEVVRAEQRRNNAPLMIQVRSNEPEALFVVHRASEGHASGIVFEHEDGQSYYVPYPDATNPNAPRDRTHQVITLLLQLIGVLQERSDVPETQTVRVIP